MSCQRCGGATVLHDEEGGTTEGRFSEEYRCVNCDARGFVSGDAGAPAREWRRYGGVFDG